LNGIQNRRLLQTTAYDGVSATVSVEGIFKMDNTFGTLYNNMFKCIMAPAADSTINITLEDVRAVATTCASATNASAEISVVRNALLTACGNDTQLLDPSVCNQLYRTLVTTAPEIAFDYYSTVNIDASIFFSMDITTEITAMNKAFILYGIRTEIGSLLGVAVNKVLVDVRPESIVNPTIASSRRLLAVTSIVFVWVYPQTAANGVAAWPPSAVPADVLNEYNTVWRIEAVPAFVSSLGVVIMNDAETTPPFSVLPLRPQLTEFSVVVAVDVGVNFNVYTTQDVATLSAAIKQEFALLLGLPETDVRILSETRFSDTQISRFSTEVRVQTEALGLSNKAILRSSAVTLAASIKTATGSTTTSPIRSVEVVTKTLANIVDTVVKDPVVEPVTGGAIVAIIILCCILFAAACGVGYYYFNGKKSKSTLQNTKHPSVVAAKPAVPVTQQMMNMPFDYRVGHAIPIQSSLYDMNYYQH